MGDKSFCPLEDVSCTLELAGPLVISLEDLLEIPSTELPLLRRLSRNHINRTATEATSVHTVCNMLGNLQYVREFAVEL